MNNLNVIQYKKACTLIPEHLGIAKNTFGNYRKLKIDSKADIPYESIVLLEHIFGLKPGELTNVDFKDKIRTLDQLIAEAKGNESGKPL